MTHTRESLEAARAYFGNMVKHGGLQGQEEDTALTTIDACLSAWPAESAVEAAITALDKHTTFSIDRSRHIARLCVEAAGLYTNARIAELEAENARLRDRLKALADNVVDYERVNKLYPNPGRKYCWNTVARAYEELGTTP